MNEKNGDDETHPVHAVSQKIELVEEAAVTHVKRSVALRIASLAHAAVVAHVGLQKVEVKQHGPNVAAVEPLERAPMQSLNTQPHQLPAGRGCDGKDTVGGHTSKEDVPRMQAHTGSSTPPSMTTLLRRYIARPSGSDMHPLLTCSMK